MFTFTADSIGDLDGGELSQWEGDFALNDDSDGFDFLEWLRQFGSGLSVTATSTGVPEPGAVSGNSKWEIPAKGSV